MKRLVYALMFTISLLTLASGQTYSSYFSTADLSFASPGALKFGLYGFDTSARETQDLRDKYMESTPRGRTQKAGIQIHFYV
jgi:hypothetical protein